MGKRASGKAKGKAGSRKRDVETRENENALARLRCPGVPRYRMARGVGLGVWGASAPLARGEE
eukprot:8687121-Pyramimonas_sp.AAC.1